MEHNDHSDSSTPNPRQLACDNCRKRKIRCDKLSPCSSCKSSNVSCCTTRKEPARRSRAQIANRYEQSIADLNHKIQKLTEALHTPSEDSHTSPVVENPPCVNISSHHEIIRGRQTSLADKSNSFEGDSSFAVHSQQATRAFEASLASTPQMQIDEALSGAMANLQKALDSSRARASSPACSGEFVDDKKSQDLSSLPHATE